MIETRVPEAASVPPENISGSPGAILRRCREFHRITLEEASETTKIGIFYLKALEDDQIREFANQAYLKGFLRIYATYLGLNSDDVARMYEKLFGVAGDKPDPTRSYSPPTHLPHRLTALRKMLLPVFLLAIILITATLFKSSPIPVMRQPQQPPVTTPPPQNIVIQMVQSSARYRKEEPAILKRKEEKRPQEPPEAEVVLTPKRQAEASLGFILRIKVTQNGTLTATVDGSAPQPYELSIGDIIEWKAEKKVALDLSSAGGVDIELNGKPYKSLGPIDKPIYVELNADGVKK